jgi:hypothetical protein
VRSLFLLMLLSRSLLIEGGRSEVCEYTVDDAESLQFVLKDIRDNQGVHDSCTILPNQSIHVKPNDPTAVFVIDTKPTIRLLGSPSKKSRNAASMVEVEVWGNSTTMLFAVSPNSTLALDSLGLRGARIAVQNEGTLNLTQVTLSGNERAVQNKEEGVVALVQNCMFDSNLGTAESGSPFLNDGRIRRIVGCTFVNNACFDDGGAIYNSKMGTIDIIEHSNFTSNDAFVMRWIQAVVFQ